jgi:hypothetical protein
MHIYTYACMHIYTHVCMHTHICMHVCTRITILRSELCIYFPRARAAYAPSPSHAIFSQTTAPWKFGNAHVSASRRRKRSSTRFLKQRAPVLVRTKTPPPALSLSRLRVPVGVQMTTPLSLLVRTYTLMHPRTCPSPPPNNHTHPMPWRIC